MRNRERNPRKTLIRQMWKKILHYGVEFYKGKGFVPDHYTHFGTYIYQFCKYSRTVTEKIEFHFDETKYQCVGTFENKCIFKKFFKTADEAIMCFKLYEATKRKIRIESDFLSKTDID